MCRIPMLVTFVAGSIGFAASASADAPRGGRRAEEEFVGMRDIPNLLIRSEDASDGGVAGACPPVISTYTNASFEGGQYVAQGGFAEGEIAACSYTVAAGDFPLRIDLCEMIFATSATTVTTTTKWSVIVWEGTPATGNIIATYSSDGKILPHLVIPPGTNGTNIQFGIDPGDPEQIIVQDNGSRTFSIGFRIDEHNNQTQNPCVVAPPSGSNAFPTTDVGGLQASTTNWLYLVNCGALGCPAGWKSFAQLPTVCRPTGDWVMRVTWTPVNCAIPGACCLPNGTCQLLSATDCGAAGGTFNGEGTQCTGDACAQDLCPCCFASTGGCITLPPASCVAAGGVAGPLGQTCTGYVCFPTGACCLPDGTCIGPVSPEQCAAQNGVFKGNNTVCNASTCPQPTGAACFPNGFCLQLTQAQANSAGATWKGPGTDCVDANGNGLADDCEQGNPADVNGDGVVNAADLSLVLGAWGAAGGAADVNDDGTVDAADLSLVLAAWN